MPWLHKRLNLVEPLLFEKPRQLAIRSLIYLDAFVPDNDKSIFDYLPDSGKSLKNQADLHGDGWKVPPIPASAFSVDPADAIWINEGRLHPDPERPDLSADQCTMGLNFETLRPRQQIPADYSRILDRIYDPVAFAGRLQRLSRMLNNSARKQRTRTEYSRHRFGNMKVLHRIMTALPEPRHLFSSALTECMTHNPDWIEYIVLLMAFYLHVGPFSRDAARLERERRPGGASRRVRVKGDQAAAGGV
jgi:Domain of unknown function (DUF4070)